MKERYIKFKNLSYKNYCNFLDSRHKLVRQIIPAVLILSIILGVGYRSIVLKEKFSYAKEAFGWYVSMASNYKRAPGMYSWDEYMFTREKPDEYIYTLGKSKFEPRAPSNSEIGWPLILYFILEDGIKGLSNVALFIARYQLMIDLSVIILLFWAGKRIAGSVGACLAPFLYAIFKIPMVQMSEVGYYYWTIPFSALSLLFWTVVYRPDDSRIKIHWKYLSFFMYGVIIGFATFLRLYFLLLPIFMSPILFIRERSVKKGIVLLMIILFGQSVFLLPQVLYNKKHFGKYAITTRGAWHLMLQGVGAYPNPWGIKDSGDLAIAAWAIERGGPDMFKSIEMSEAWFKKEYFKLFKERPDIFIRNALRNIQVGITISPHSFEFFGVIPQVGGGDHLLNKIFPWLVLFALFILFIMSKVHFWIMLSAFFQGIYLLLIVLLWFPAYTPFIASYIPVFVLLLAVAVAIYIKMLIAILEGSMRCWVNNYDIRSLPIIVRECYCEDWSVGYGSIERPIRKVDEKVALNKEEPVIEKIKENKNLKFKIIFIAAAVSILSIVSVVSIWVIFKKEDPLSRKGLLSRAYAVWAMDDGAGDNLKDTKGTHDAVSVNSITGEGHFGKARYFNGKDSYIKTSVNFKGWKGVTISLWVKPEKKDNNKLSVILDNGHNATSNFVIQNADINNPSNERWVFHCNGADIFLTIPFNKWTHLVISVDGERGVIQAYVDDISMGKVTMGKGFEFGDVPLTIGKLANMDDRYFKGGIDEVVIMDKAIAIR